MKDLCEVVVKVALKAQKIDDVIILIEKYGWINGVVDILDDLCRKEKYNGAKNILRNAKNNQELAHYSEKHLQDNF